MRMIKICDPHPQRGDREVIDEDGKVLGFVWKWSGSWVARIGDQSAQYFPTLASAKNFCFETLSGAKK